MAEVAGTTKRPIEVGLFLIAADIPYGGCVPSWQDLVAVATRADVLGFDSLWLADHLLADFGWESEPRISVRECWSLISALAAVTQRIQLGPLVSCTAYRNPAMLAATADTVQEISKGRLFLGLGAGWHKPEFQSFGFPYDHRASRFEEAVQIISGLLGGERVTFEGKFYQARDCELRPRGQQPPKPPIVIGAKGPRMLELTARYADGWDSDFIRNPADYTQVREKLVQVDAACHSVGRDPATLHRSVTIQVNMPGHSRPEDHPFAAGRASSPPASGTPEELAELLLAYAAEGVSRVQVSLDPSTVEAVEALAPVLDILDESA
ncbi:MAG TPA: LLM class flavin-dependent oxidoreductase [Thermomicrobiales bacterium]|nr:LLM class flavin-dependent oxidoreductase [Thermomicrobiales bacterium]